MGRVEDKATIRAQTKQRPELDNFKGLQIDRAEIGSAVWRLQLNLGGYGTYVLNIKFPTGKLTDAFPFKAPSVIQISPLPYGAHPYVNQHGRVWLPCMKRGSWNPRFTVCKILEQVKQLVE